MIPLMTRRLLLFLLAASAPATAQFISGRTTTSFYSWEGRNEAFETRMYARFYETVQLSVNDNRFAFTSNLSASKDFGATIPTDPELRVSALSLKLKRVGGVADLTAGRQFVFAGVGNGLIDGAMVSARLWRDRIGVAAFIDRGQDGIPGAVV